MIWCAIDEDDNSEQPNSRRRHSSSHISAVDCHDLLPLSVEAQFVQDILDRVSLTVFFNLSILQWNPFAAFRLLAEPRAVTQGFVIFQMKRHPFSILTVTS